MLQFQLRTTSQNLSISIYALETLRAGHGLDSTGTSLKAKMERKRLLQGETVLCLRPIEAQMLQDAINLLVEKDQDAPTLKVLREEDRIEARRMLAALKDYSVSLSRMIREGVVDAFDVVEAARSTPSTVSQEEASFREKRDAIFRTMVGTPQHLDVWGNIVSEEPPSVKEEQPEVPTMRALFYFDDDSRKPEVHTLHWDSKHEEWGFKQQGAVEALRASSFAVGESGEILKDRDGSPPPLFAQGPSTRQARARLGFEIQYGPEEDREWREVACVALAAQEKKHLRSQAKSWNFFSTLRVRLQPTGQEKASEYSAVVNKSKMNSMGRQVPQQVPPDKYTLMGRDGTPVDKTVADMHRRVAQEFATTENDGANPVDSESKYEPPEEE